MTAIYGMAAVAQIPVGFMVDRYGARVALTFGLVMMSLGFGLMSVVHDFQSMVILGLIAATGNSVFHPADYAILNSSISTERMGRAFSIHTFAGHVGSAVAPVSMLFIASLFGWRAALIASGLFGLLAGHAQEWFVPVQRYHLDFPVEGSLGIQKGSSVEILGAAVGKVERISVAPDGHMTGELSVKGDFIRFVRADSQAIVKKRYGIAGDAFIDITKGKGAELPAESRLEVTRDMELTFLLANLLEQIRSTTVPAVEELQKTVVEYGKLAEIGRAHV